jgi:uncharacterized protein
LRCDGLSAFPMKIKLAPGLRIAESKIEGKGCFATQFFSKRRKIAEYAGEVITAIEAARRARRRRHHRVCAINSRWSLDGSKGGNGTHYINHSCAPNAFMKTIHGHILFIALRDIQAGEEITVDYVETYHPDRKRCRCGAPSCRGTINKTK